MYPVPKYRPTLTLAQIDAILEAIGYVLTSCENVTGKEDLINAAKSLRLMQFKAQINTEEC
jgi:hypothetical protein